MLAVAGWFKFAPFVLLPVSLAPLRDRRLAAAVAAVVAVSLPMLALLVALGGLDGPRAMLHAVSYQFSRGSKQSVWERTRDRVDAAVRAGRRARPDRGRRASPCAANPWLATDRSRMAALMATILIGLQLAANYWAFLYLVWVVPLIGCLGARQPGRGDASGGGAGGRIRGAETDRRDRTMTGRAARLVGFDGLRAVAALSVLSYHVALWGAFVTPALAPLLWELKGGVAIFFVISGALLYLPYARAMRDQRPLPGWRIFAQRRAVRILPAYWLALTVVAIGPFGAHVIGPQIWKYYALSQVYDGRTLLGGVGVAWSLCVEVTFYALLPLFAWLVACGARHRGHRARARIQLALIATVGCASLGLRIALAGSLSAPIPFHGQPITVALPGLLDWFAIGMGLAVFRAELEAGRATPRLAGLATSRRLCSCSARVPSWPACPYNTATCSCPGTGR